MTEGDERATKPEGMTGMSRTTQRNAVASAAVALQVGKEDVELILKRLFDIGREQGRLQSQKEVTEARLEASKARERATRYSSELTHIRGVASRLREDGVKMPQDLIEAVWPKKVG